ncbi:hypothetical protein HanIR_Chr17g0869691 [Helianthus annuus]|nr:hypothetical protein HanIR_Chr17g0869691 [Helianthus annuus]
MGQFSFSPFYFLLWFTQKYYLLFYFVNNSHQKSYPLFYLPNKKTLIETPKYSCTTPKIFITIRIRIRAPITQGGVPYSMIIHIIFAVKIEIYGDIDSASLVPHVATL